MTVSALNQVEVFLYMLIGICNNMPAIMIRQATRSSPEPQTPQSAMNNLRRLRHPQGELARARDVRLRRRQSQLKRMNANGS